MCEYVRVREYVCVCVPLCVSRAGVCVCFTSTMAFPCRWCCVCVQSGIHSRANKRTHTHVHARTHTNTHKHTHTLTLTCKHAQGDPLEWASSHRYHHLHTDTPLDPHSPYEGFWWSHFGWLLDNKVCGCVSSFVCDCICVCVCVCVSALLFGGLFFPL